jgi:hypothetical protein
MNMRLAISFCRSTNFIILDLKIKSYGYLKILEEVWARHACDGANQQELTTYAKKLRARRIFFLERWSLGHPPKRGRGQRPY